jgi:hypothetical protein
MGPSRQPDPGLQEQKDRRPGQPEGGQHPAAGPVGGQDHPPLLPDLLPIPAAEDQPVPVPPGEGPPRADLRSGGPGQLEQVGAHLGPIDDPVRLPKREDPPDPARPQVEPGDPVADPLGREIGPQPAQVGGDDEGAGSGHRPVPLIDHHRPSGGRQPPRREQPGGRGPDDADPLLASHP